MRTILTIAALTLTMLFVRNAQAATGMENCNQAGGWICAPHINASSSPVSLPCSPITDNCPIILPTQPKIFTLITQSYAGRISITHGLTKDECEARKDNALGVPHTDEEKAAIALFAREDQEKEEKQRFAEKKAEAERKAACDKQPKESLCHEVTDLGTPWVITAANTYSGPSLNQYGAVHTSDAAMRAECIDKPLK